MDGYPAGALDHNVPLLVASGFDGLSGEDQLDEKLRGQGNRLQSQLPPVEGKEAEVIEEHFKEVDAKGASWSAVRSEDSYRFRIKTAGRSFVLPPRQAQLPETIEPLETARVLHSPFSPLSPSSTLYPDGLINAQWIKKHQNLVPSVLACFYTLTNDRSTMTLQDNHLKADINNMKAMLAKSGYKTRLAVVLLIDNEAASKPSLSAEGTQERLELIRKGTALGPNSIFYVPPQESPAELKRVIDNVLSVLYITATEYYRDLGRHARKKRSRGIAPQPTVPPTSGTSQTLSLPDWNFRYDFKSAIFAEFRYEVDTALKSFDHSYETLLGADVLDIIPSWSPRWNEARLLSDIISIRCISLHLWLEQTSLAVRRWQFHRDRISDLVERRGRGTNNYGWQAWEATWAMVMANLMERIGVPGLSPSTMTLFHEPEKAVHGQRLQPWELLHHTGYWYRIAARHLYARRALARAMPEEDRASPDSSPASHVASKAYTYDTYLCPEPYQEYSLAGKGVDHSQLIIDCLIAAGAQYQARKQLRVAAEISLECAEEMAKTEKWTDMLAILRPLWENLAFRSEGWLDITEELCWLMRKAAAETGRGDLVVAIDWELLSDSEFQIHEFEGSKLIRTEYTRRRNWHYDLSKSLNGIPTESRPVVQMSNDDCGSFISSSFVFRTKQSRAGQACIAQLALSSHAMSDSVPVVLDSVHVTFSGHIRPIIVSHQEGSSEETSSITQLSLTEGFSKDSEDEMPSELKGRCDLTIQSGQTRVLEMTIPLREAGEVEASSIELHYKHETFDIEFTHQLSDLDQPAGWHVEGSSRRRHAREGERLLHIDPRPPKMEVKFSDPLDQYYANEVIELRFELLNLEDEAATVKLDTHLFGKEIPSFKIQAGSQEHVAEAAKEESHANGLSLETIPSSSSSTVVVTIDPTEVSTTYDIHLRATYHLESDVATPIIQMLPVQLNVFGAFEANYDLVPRLHSDPWPSLFDHEGILESGEEDGAAVQARGLAQKWCLSCHYASFAHEDLKVVDVDVKILSCVGGARCDVARRPDVPEEGIVVAPKTMHEAQFDLIAQKLSLDDRHTVSVDLAFVIRWQRHGVLDSPVNTTTMLVGNYLVLSPEPRVLATVYRTTAPEASGLIHLDITIENPSNHFLTFGLAMEPSEEFGFSGSKQTTLHLLPMARRTTTYRLLPLVTGKYIRPGLVVRDKYFQKTLRIIPTEGMKIDKDGLLLWVPDEDDEETEETA